MTCTLEQDSLLLQHEQRRRSSVETHRHKCVKAAHVCSFEIKYYCVCVSVSVPLWLSSIVSGKDVESEVEAGWSAPGRRCCSLYVRLWGSSTQPSGP